MNDRLRTISRQGAAHEAVSAPNLNEKFVAVGPRRRGRRRCPCGPRHGLRYGPDPKIVCGHQRLDYNQLKPTSEIIQEAMQNPNGWVYLILGKFDPNESVPSEAYSGA